MLAIHNNNTDSALFVLCKVAGHRWKVLCSMSCQKGWQYIWYKTSHDTSQEANHTLAYPSIIKRQGVLVISSWIHHRATALALSFLSSLLYYSWVKWDSEIQLSNLTWTFLYRIQGMYHLAAVNKLNKGKYGLFR